MWDQDAALLCAAITNNFGVWLHDNGDTGNAYFCFGALSSMIGAWDAPAEAVAGFHANLKQFNVPVIENGSPQQIQHQQFIAAAKRDLSATSSMSSSESENFEEEEDAVMMRST